MFGRPKLTVGCSANGRRRRRRKKKKKKKKKKTGQISVRILLYSALSTKLRFHRVVVPMEEEKEEEEEWTDLSKEITVLCFVN